MVFTLTLSEDAANTFTVDYASVDGTATEADGDFTAVSGTATINQGSRTADISVFVNGDSDFELNESFELVISNPQGIELSAASINGLGTINNDETAEPKGYFTGSATVNSTALTDMTGMMYDNRLMMFSPTANVLYDITFTDITVNDFTATATVYVNGDINDAGSQSSVSLSGTTDEATINGTFSGGSGLADGSFELTFDVNNNVGATLARIEGTLDRYTGDIYGIDNDSSGRFSSDALGDYSISDSDGSSCGISPGAVLVIPDNLLNIYLLDHDVVDRISCEYISLGHTGFASVVSVNSVNTVVFAYANGSVSLFGVMTK